MCVWARCAYLVPMEARRGYWVLWNWNNRQRVMATDKRLSTERWVMLYDPLPANDTGLKFTLRTLSLMRTNVRKS